MRRTAVALLGALAGLAAAAPDAHAQATPPPVPATPAEATPPRREGRRPYYLRYRRV